jgi:hypothetical protein
MALRPPVQSTAHLYEQWNPKCEFDQARARIAQSRKDAKKSTDFTT